MNRAAPAIALDTSGSVTQLSGFGRPFNVARDAARRLLVADMDLHMLLRFTPELDGYECLDSEAGWSPVAPVSSGTVAASPPRDPLRFNGPHAVAVAPDGGLVVTTYYSPAIHFMATDGASVSVIERLSDRLTLKGPATAHFDATGRLLLSEYALNMVIALDRSGRFMAALGGGAERFVADVQPLAGSGPAFFDRPHMCRALPSGALIVADTWNHRLQRFDADGVFQGALGDGRPGWCDASESFDVGAGDAGFHAPVSIGICNDDRFVVSDWGNGRLQWFSPDGRLLAVDETLGLDHCYDAQVFDGHCIVANSHRGTILIKRLDA